MRDVGKSCRRVGEGDPPGGKGLAWVGHKYLMDESDGKEGGGHAEAGSLPYARNVFILGRLPSRLPAIVMWVSRRDDESPNSN